ncbi:MAG: phosphoribosylanthranilate isomerase [Dehalococcoidia bacterium]|nr:phosphoribosylanthranilate isomerase [Dehalococcoidia bacterium]
MTLVKICGLRDAETAIETAKAGADFIGLVFAESKRRVTPQECYDIVEAIKGGRAQGREASFDGPVRGEVSARSWFGAWADTIEQSAARWRPLIVGVFAGMTAGEVNDIADAAGLDLVQLSGGEDDDFVRQVARPVIRVVHVHEGMAAGDAEERFAPGVPAGLMLDAGSKGALGGTGQSFDWSVAAEVAPRTPFLLAGGLTPENVAEAITTCEPWGVDVSSGVETNGTKDIDKIRAFIRAAKGVRIGR